jgi:hypothetical protein
MKWWLLMGGLGSSLAIGAACGGKSDSPTSARAQVTLSGEAAAKWNTLCVTCHGKEGHGDGPGAATLNPKPRSFGDAAWQASVDDEHLKKAIVGGGPAVKLSNLMPPNPDLERKPAVVDELVAKIRSLGP